MPPDVLDQEIQQRLAKYGRFGVHLGLERIQRLLADLGNPHHQVPVIHVAGTNGKGSVCAYLSSVLTQAGVSGGALHLTALGQLVRTALFKRPAHRCVYPRSHVGPGGSSDRPRRDNPHTV